MKTLSMFLLADRVITGVLNFCYAIDSRVAIPVSVWSWQLQTQK